MPKEYSDYMAPHRAKSKPCFEGYTGNRSWKVSNPDHGEITVIAPSNPAAIVTAAGVWGCRWQAYDFYSNCQVTFCGTVVKNKK